MSRYLAGTYTWPFVTWALIAIMATIVGLLIGGLGFVAYAAIKF